MMKRTFWLIALSLLSLTLSASDSLRIHNPQIPILLDRIDNVLFQIRVPDAVQGDVLESLTVEFSPDTDLKSIAELRLFYSGTEAVRRQGLRFSPVEYISAHNVWNTRSANPSYSVMQEQASKIGRKVVLHSRQPMVGGINYYWVSVRMNPDASLLTELRARVSEVVVDGKKVPVACDSSDVVRRVGYGVRHAGDDHSIWVMAVWTHGMGNGRAWTNSMPGMEPIETPQLMLSRSDDDGRTWSKPINITKQVKDPSWCFLLQGPGRGITMRDGILVFAIQFIDKDRMPHAGIMYSKDHGETWHIHNPARSNTTEAQVAEVEPGVLMLNMRDNRGGARAVMTTRDLGRTWTEHVSHRTTLREPVCMASLIAVPAEKNVLGKDLLLFSNPDTTDGRRDITIKASLDGGVTWPYSLLLDEGDSWGYSCLTMIDSQTVGILYESSVAHITFQAVRLEDVVR